MEDLTDLGLDQRQPPEAREEEGQELDQVGIIDRLGTPRGRAGLVPDKAEDGLPCDRPAGASTSWSQNAARFGPASYLPWRSHRIAPMATRNCPDPLDEVLIEVRLLADAVHVGHVGVPSALGWTRPDRSMQATARYQ